MGSTTEFISNQNVSYCTALAPYWFCHKKSATFILAEASTLVEIWKWWHDRFSFSYPVRTSHFYLLRSSYSASYQISVVRIIRHLFFSFTESASLATKEPSTFDIQLNYKTSSLSKIVAYSFRSLRFWFDLVTSLPTSKMQKNVIVHWSDHISPNYHNVHCIKLSKEKWWSFWYRH